MRACLLDWHCLCNIYMHVCMYMHVHVPFTSTRSRVGRGQVLIKRLFVIRQRTTLMNTTTPTTTNTLTTTPAMTPFILDLAIPLPSSRLSSTPIGNAVPLTGVGDSDIDLCSVTGEGVEAMEDGPDVRMASVSIGPKVE